MSCKGETFATPADTSGKIKHRFSFHPDVCLWTKTRFFSGLEVGKFATNSRKTKLKKGVFTLDS
jgi:hypothetical protein